MTSSSLEPHKPVVNDLGKFVSFISEFRNDRWIFRGQPNIADPLMPKAGRPAYFLKNNGDLERFSRWSHQAVAFCPELPENDFERLAFARHYGLATRLLDWSANALVALYFATEGEPAGPINPNCSRTPEPDGGVFIYLKPTGEIDVNHHRLTEQGGVMFYSPRPIVRRIMAQDGIFTFHPCPNVPLEPQPLPSNIGHPPNTQDLVVVRVPAAKKRKLQSQLRDVGVLARSIYPDIEGLSKSINLVTHWMAHPRPGIKTIYPSTE